jgi:hypothetical protein
MNRISDINIIREFENNGNIYGIYSIVFNGEQKILIRNEKSIGAVSHSVGEPANKCVWEIRDDVKQEFLEKLEYKKNILSEV